MKTKSNIFLVFIGLVFIILASCAGREVYPGFHHIENGKWHRDSLLRFTIDSLGPFPGREYKVTIELTTNRGYHYRDLWLLVDQDLSDSLVHTDTLHYYLADEYGRWLGASAGGLNQLSLPYRSFMLRDSTYHYRLAIRHTMEDKMLRGVEKVGIKLVEVNRNY